MKMMIIFSLTVSNFITPGKSSLRSGPHPHRKVSFMGIQLPSVTRYLLARPPENQDPWDP